MKLASLGREGIDSMVSTGVGGENGDQSYVKFQLNNKLGLIGGGQEFRNMSIKKVEAANARLKA